jgi:CheY-like chemotaxis protein
MTRVLVIDDCEELTDILAELLKQDGFSVDVAHSSTDGLDRLQSSQFDAVLCDLVLPLERGELESESDSAMVGAYCIREITARFPGVPVIAMSGELVGGPLSMVERFGARATISKPFGRTELLTTLRGVLSN